MKKKLIKGIGIVFSLFVSVIAFGQNPGLVISEVYANPVGTDSCKEYVELRATNFIDFSVTPYSVIVCNNGTANSSGWITGGTLSYAFSINSGTINAGDIVYAGGGCMAPTGTKIRAINVSLTPGDGGIGNNNNAGVFGNGGGNADGIAVFNTALANVTSSTVPVDALFWGTGIGTASIGSTLGYQLPINDLYSGGKLLTTSFFTSDPGPDIITATGMFNTTTNTWSTPRTFSITPSVTLTSTSSVSLTTSASPAVISFLSNDTTVSEVSPSANIYVRLTTTSTASCAINIVATAWSNATASDYTLATGSLTFAANAPVNSSAAVTINISNDVIVESAEYIILKLTGGSNANIGTINQMAVYIKDNDKPIPAPSNALALNLLASFSNTVSGSNSAEIVSHDPTTQRLYIANSLGAKVDIIDFINPSAPTLISSINITPYGNINSVAVRNGLVACAVENSNPQDTGKIVFFDKDGNFLKQVNAGAMPDMITFNHAGTRVITANEGEPNATYTNDPEGSITVVDISGGIASLSQANVTQIGFTAYNGQETTLKAQGIRIYGGPSPTSSKDFEPEYVSVSKDDTKAWVTLQENNAVVEINLTNNTISNIKALGSKNHMLLNNGMDVSNQTKGINISNFPVKGLYLPDAIASYTVGGVNYYITANEGDARAYSAFTEERRISAMTLDPTKFPNSSELKNNYVLGRLNGTDKTGDIDNDGDIDTIFVYGSRSFSIWNASTGVQVYDSGDDLEQITASNSFSVMFNASNTTATSKDRSDDKGPEPEGVTIGTIGANVYAFIALERIGGVMVYDVTNPNSPVYVTYVNNRTLSTNGPDRGAEGIIFIPQSESPNGQHIVIAANEISSTLSIWGIPGCNAPLSTSLAVSGGTTGCAGTTTLSIPAGTGLSYQWSQNSSILTGATNNSLVINTSGNYAVSITGGANCFANSLTQSITVNPSPTLIAVSSNTQICSGQNATLTVSGASTYSWSTGSNSTSIIISPTVTTNYTVSGTVSNSCVSSVAITQSVSTCAEIYELGVNSNVIVYPNPTEGQINIDFNSTGGHRITVYNLIGQEIIAMTTEDNSTKIDLSHVQKGIYYIVTEDNNSKTISKLILN